MGTLMSLFASRNGSGTATRRAAALQVDALEETGGGSTTSAPAGPGRRRDAAALKQPRLVAAHVGHDDGPGARGLAHPDDRRDDFRVRWSRRVRASRSQAMFRLDDHGVRPRDETAPCRQGPRWRAPRAAAGLAVPPWATVISGRSAGRRRDGRDPPGPPRPPSAPAPAARYAPRPMRCGAGAARRSTRSRKARRSDGVAGSSSTSLDREPPVGPMIVQAGERHMPDSTTERRSGRPVPSAMLAMSFQSSRILLTPWSLRLFSHESKTAGSRRPKWPAGPPPIRARRPAAERPLRDAPVDRSGRGGSEHAWEPPLPRRRQRGLCRQGSPHRLDVAHLERPTEAVREGGRAARGHQRAATRG